jgi:hypothetical protein
VNRLGILSLLDELLAAFESMRSAPIVSIAKIEKSKEWELQVKWLVEAGEKVRLADFALKNGLTMRESKDCTFFR